MFCLPRLFLELIDYFDILGVLNLNLKKVVYLPHFNYCSEILHICSKSAGEKTGKSKRKCPRICFQ